MIFGAKIQITLLSKMILLSNFQTLWKRSWIIKLSPCWPVFVPQRVGTGLPPVTKKKSVEHWPLKSGGLMSKVSKSMRICKIKKVMQAKKKSASLWCLLGKFHYWVCLSSSCRFFVGFEGWQSRWNFLMSFFRNWTQL